MTLKRMIQKTAFHIGLTGQRGLSRHRSHGHGTLEIFFGHHVLTAGAAAPDLKENELHDRLQYLRRTREVVSLEEGVARLPEISRGERLAALTFDDGYEDNLRHLLPVLLEAQTPATVFVSTHPVIDNCGLWYDEVRTALGQSELRQLPLEWLPASYPGGAALGDAAAQALKRTGPRLREQRLAELWEHVPQECRRLLDHQAMLSESGLAELAADPLISIGAHTHTHTVISACDLEEAEEEVGLNVELLQQLTGRRPTSFAYPNGGAGDFTPRDQTLLKRLGIGVAVTTIKGLNQARHDPLALKRLPLGEGPVEAFAWQIDGR